MIETEFGGWGKKEGVGEMGEEQLSHHQAPANTCQIDSAVLLVLPTFFSKEKLESEIYMQ